jgi:hypothetical protein
MTGTPVDPLLLLLLLATLELPLDPLAPALVTLEARRGKVPDKLMFYTVVIQIDIKWL